MTVSEQIVDEGHPDLDGPDAEGCPTCDFLRAAMENEIDVLRRRGRSADDNRWHAAAAGFNGSAASLDEALHLSAGGGK